VTQIRRHHRLADPPASRPVVVDAAAVVQDADGSVLLLEPTGGGLWTLPQATPAAREAVGHAIIRTLSRDLGITVEIEALVGTYLDPDPADRGHDPRTRISACMRARLLGRRPAWIPGARWIDHDKLDDLAMDESTRLRITHALEHRAQPYIGASPHPPRPTGLRRLMRRG
jgi:ADP-ribose pyrophosphatase YjhB (NUDIX family)